MRKAAPIVAFGSLNYFIATIPADTPEAPRSRTATSANRISRSKDSRAIARATIVPLIVWSFDRTTGQT
jgi:hypothetical protein